MRAACFEAAMAFDDVVERVRVDVVSLSGGKDSQAAATVCLDQRGAGDVRLLFCDTGNEHPLTLEHIHYLSSFWGVEVVTLRATFDGHMARKREYILSVWPTEGIPLAVCERAASLLVPSGNPYLDLCLWKGRFPSRKVQFCTQELKRRPLDAYMIDVLATGAEAWSWQGTRRDESARRAGLAARERGAEGWWIERPVVDWTAQQVVDFCAGRGQRLNPLYSEGFDRVGCAPCINSGKDDVLNWSRRHPEVIDRIREWEALVGQASKHSAASFFPAPEKGGRGERQGRNIVEYVDWSRTAHGGRQYDLVKAINTDGCESSYGLCE